MRGDAIELADLRARLERLGKKFAEAEGMPGFEAHRPESERLASYMAIGEVIAFFDIMGWRGLDRHLKPIFNALADVEQGHAHPMLTPPDLDGRRQTRTIPATLRGRVAKVLEWLIHEGKWPPKDAAAFVLKALGAEVVDCLRDQKYQKEPLPVTWKTVARWRTKAREGGGTIISDSFQAGVWAGETLEPNEANARLQLGAIAKNIEWQMMKRLDHPEALE
jgi:hypothetical protein